MELFMTLLTQYPMEFVGFLFVVIAFIYGLIMRRALTSDELAKMLGISKQLKDLLVYIFDYADKNHVKLNSTLVSPVMILPTEELGKQKQKVAVQAMKEMIPNKKLKKLGDLFEFATWAYDKLYPFVKKVIK